MTLRGKLLLAQAPLAIALALVGVLSAAVTSRLADQSRLILADNYRSVLAAQRMKERWNASTGRGLPGGGPRGDPARNDRAAPTGASRRELAVQEGNITEAGERAR